MPLGDTSESEDKSKDEPGELSLGTILSLGY